MSQIFIIAGPPGVGKSINGAEFIRPGLDIINEDEVQVRNNDQQQAVLSARELVKRQLITGKDFAYELNLGCQEQYDYIIAAKGPGRQNKLHVILFFSDSLQLCLDRVKIRHENGSDFVPAAAVTELYNNTIPLLKSNFEEIDTLRLIDAKITGRLSPAAEYMKEEKRLRIRDFGPKWLLDEVLPFISQHLVKLKGG